jgi:hypothetical protein
MACFVTLGLVWLIHADAGAAERAADQARPAKAADLSEIVPAQYTDDTGGAYAPVAPSAPYMPGLGMDQVPKGQHWVSGSYLLWIMKNQPMSVSVAGDGVHTLLGDRSFNDKRVDGFRVDLGGLLDDEQTLGIEAGFLAFYENTPRSTVATSTTVLNRPFFDVGTGHPGNFPVAVPGASAGFVSMRPDGFLVGGEINTFYRAFQGEYDYLDFIVGFRNVDLDEKVNVTSATDIVTGGGSFAGVPVAAPAHLIIRDQVATRNIFNGGQIGTRFQTGTNGFLLSGYGKVAFGIVDEYSILTGTSSAAARALGAAPITVPGGFLVTRDNSGKQSQSHFAVVPEVGANFGFEMTPNVVIGLGYSLLYVNNVVRPGIQLSRRVDLRAVPTSPTFSPPHAGEQFTRVFNTSDFWAQGLNLSATCRF